MSLFLLLAYALSWAVWPLVALNPDSSPLVPFGPLIAALAVALLSGGTPELGRLVAQLGRWRRSPRWYLTALVGPLALTAAAAGVTVVARGAPPAARIPDLTLVAATFTATVVVVGLFEEPGWRGFVVPRLQRRLSGVSTALVIGVFWGLWHLPELVSDPTQQRPLLPFVISVLAQSVILSWLYNSTRGSLPIAMVSHAAVNTAAQFVLPQFAGPDYQFIWWCLTGLWVVAAVVVVARTGPALASDRPIPGPRRRGHTTADTTL